MNKNFKKHAIEFSMSLLSIIILAFGLAAIVIASIGFDPWGILFNGALLAYNKITPESLHFLKYGDMITIISTFFVFLVALVKRTKVKWLSILSGIFLGQFVNLWINLWQFITIPNIQFGIFPFTSLLILTIGILALSLGSSIALSFSMLMSPVDYLISTISNTFSNHAYGHIRIIADTSAVIIGVIIVFAFTFSFNQTQVGVGTIILFFAVGYVINLILPSLTKLLSNIKSNE